MNTFLTPDELEHFQKKKMEMEETLKGLQSKNIEENKAESSAQKEPAYDLYLHDSSLYLDMELPGVREDFVSVEVTSSYIQISAETQVPVHKNAHYITHQRRELVLNYRLPLPEGLTVQGYDIRWDCGVLHLKASITSNADTQDL